MAHELSRGGGAGKEYMCSAHQQGHAQSDGCGGWEETRCTLRMTFLPRVTSFNSICQGRQFPGDYSHICGYVW